MTIDQPNPFASATIQQWEAEVSAKADQLLRDGVASDPASARRMAERSVQSARQARAQHALREEVLTKVIHDTGGPL